MSHNADPRARLRDAGLHLQAPNDQAATPPWYLQTLQGLGGWLSALFLMVFVGTSFTSLLMLTPTGLILGAVMIGGAYSLLRAQHSVFGEQLVLAFSLAGQLLVAYSISQWLDFGIGFWLCLFALHVALSVLMANRLHQIFSSFFAALSLFFLGIEAGLFYWVPPLALAVACGLWLNEFRYPLQLKALRSIAMGVTLGLLAMQYLSRFPEAVGTHTAATLAPHWFGEWLTGGVLLYLAHSVLKTNRVALSPPCKAIGVGALVLLCLASSFAFGLTQGAVLLALGFAISHRLLTGLGVISLLFSISTYYYRLDLTLLEKSATLLVLGLLLLAARYFLRQWPHQSAPGGSPNA